VSNGYIITFFNKYPINFNVRSPSHASTVLQYYIFNDLNLSYSKKISFIFIFSWKSSNSISHQINFSYLWVKLHLYKDWILIFIILSWIKSEYLTEMTSIFNLEKVFEILDF
jgi:hypothetical protein